MNRLWRISNRCDLEGMGGEFSTGRWHTPERGRRIVYLAEHPAVALLETLVHLRGNPRNFPERYQLIEIEVSPELLTQAEALPLNSNISTTQATGNNWLQSKKSALAVVPSLPSPKSKNYLLNPLHPEAREARILECSWIEYDQRIFKVVDGTIRPPFQLEPVKSKPPSTPKPAH